jgi:hypothetical protein
MYRVRGKQVAETLGTVALIPKLSDARERARESLLAAKRGINPVAERRAQTAKAEEAAKTTADTTVEAVFKVYVQRELRPKTKARTALGVEQYFAKDVLPRLGKRALSDISSKDIERLLDGVVARGSPVAANRRRLIHGAVRGAACRRQDPEPLRKDQRRCGGLQQIPVFR